jgi:glucosyl-3-phosphoglycerate synthase
MPELGLQDGKGEALWKSLHVTRGELVVFLDGDVEQLPASYVVGLLGPLLTDPDIAYVKGAYERPVSPGSAGGGRVTELVARPLLATHWPELSGFVQPLAGEAAGRRSVLEQVPFASGYGVELALLVDLLERVGLQGLAQVDLGTRVHRNRPDTDLAPMAASILAAAADRLPGAEPATALTRFTRVDGHFAPIDTELQTAERPPYRWLPALAG